LLYVNRMNLRNAKRDTSLGLEERNFKRALRCAGKVIRSMIKRKYMASVAAKIAEPFHEVLAGRHVLPHPMEIIETLERNHETHGNIEGESPLSTGIAYYFMHDMIHPHGDACISGIFHVGPFTCMQEGVATAKIEAMVKEFRKTKPDLVFPIVHAFFGARPTRTWREIAVFREQCCRSETCFAKSTPRPRPADTRRCVHQGDMTRIPTRTDSAQSRTGMDGGSRELAMVLLHMGRASFRSPAQWP
jgi:hypothetical protein